MFTWGNPSPDVELNVPPNMAELMILLALWPPWWAVLAARAGIGANLGSTATLQFAQVTRHVGVGERGQFLGLATAVQHFGSLVGFLGGGALALLWGESGNFLLAAALYFTVAGLAAHAVGHAVNAKVTRP